MFTTVYTSVLPLIQQNYANKVQIIFRQQIQPWHPSSTLVHEAGAAVLQTQPDKFWQFSHALFDQQTEFFDTSVVNETRNRTYERLAEIAGGVGVDRKKVFGLLEVSDRPGEGGANGGNGVTDDVKLMVKVCGFGIVLCMGNGILTMCAGESSYWCSCYAYCIVQRKKPLVDFIWLLYSLTRSQGVVENGISSSFSKDDWAKWLEKNIA